MRFDQIFFYFFNNLLIVFDNTSLVCDNYAIVDVVEVEWLCRHAIVVTTQPFSYSFSPKHKSPASPKPGTIYLCGLSTGSTVATHKSTSSALVCFKT